MINEYVTVLENNYEEDYNSLTSISKSNKKPNINDGLKNNNITDVLPRTDRNVRNNDIIDNIPRTDRNVNNNDIIEVIPRTDRNVNNNNNTETSGSNENTEPPIIYDGGGIGGGIGGNADDLIESKQKQNKKSFLKQNKKLLIFSGILIVGYFIYKNYKNKK